VISANIFKQSFGGEAGNSDFFLTQSHAIGAGIHKPPGIVEDMMKTKDMADLVGCDTFVMHGGEIGYEEGTGTEGGYAVGTTDVAGVGCV